MKEKTLGGRIRTARKDKGFSSEKLAELCNINAAYVRQIESGAKVPSLQIFVSLCNALGVSPNYLLKYEVDEGVMNSISDIERFLDNADEKSKKIVLSMIQSAMDQLSE